VPGEALHSAQQTGPAPSGEQEAWVSNLSCRGRLIWDDRFREYDFGPQHPLRPERFAHGLDLLRESDLWRPDSETLQPLTASRQELELVHSPEYVNAVDWLGDGGPTDPGLAQVHGLGLGDNPAFGGMHDVSALIAGGTLTAARSIMAGEIDHAFNPAGGLHHAMRDRAWGFCIYNDAAVAIAALLREHDVRVLYLDFDAHHGDGVQALFYDEPRVLTFSIHETGRHLFPGTGEVAETGAGPGQGFSVNSPMEPYTQDESWLGAVRALVPTLAERFEPDFIVSQHGCDSHAWDPLTHLGITTRAMAEQAGLVHRLAHTYAGGRWIALGGGGYDYRRVVPRMYALLLSQVVSRPLPERLPEPWRARWANSGSESLPTSFVDPAEVAPPGPRLAEIERRNQETVERALRGVLAQPLGPR
jgi:acetoin utilization protein AcuC